jgi:hypothetical protein
MNKKIAALLAYASKFQASMPSDRHVLARMLSRTVLAAGLCAVALAVHAGSVIQLVVVTVVALDYRGRASFQARGPTTESRVRSPMSQQTQPRRDPLVAGGAKLCGGRVGALISR